MFIVLPAAENNNKRVSVEILSRDSVTVSVDAVVYFNVIDAELALCSVDDFRYGFEEEFSPDNNNFSAFSHSTRLLAATTLRNVLGTKNLSQILGSLHYTTV